MHFSFVLPDSWDLINLFTLYSDFKQLPFVGTILDQPAPMIDAFRIFQEELNAVFGPERIADDDASRRYPGCVLRGQEMRNKGYIGIGPSRDNRLWATTGERIR